MRAALVLGLFATACDPYGRWPVEQSVFPWVYTPLEDLQPYEEVRFETETWVPLQDIEQTVLYVQKSVEHRPGAPLEELLHFGQGRPEPLVGGHPWLSFAGDVMPMNGTAPSYASGVSPLLDGDFRVGNLETPISAEHPTGSELTSKFGIYAFNEPATMLVDQPFDLLQVNNNHSLDLGDAGFANTHQAVLDAGMQTVGFDGNRFVADVQGSSVAFLSYTWGSNNTDPTEVDLAVVPFGRLDEAIDLGRIASEVGQARDDGASHVVLLLHWGYEYEYWPDPHFLVLGRRLVALGADVVVGHGPHTPQAAELCSVNQPLAEPGIGQCSVRSEDGRRRMGAVLYSLGNFGTNLATVELQTGIVGTVSLDPMGGVSGMGWEALARVDTSDGRALRPLDELVEQEGGQGRWTDESTRLQQLLGTSWRRTR
ncbi:MAG: CapA family protein [Myxococcales bacterium]|nr:CapA family protein [Myxococcales bacterium]